MKNFMKYFGFIALFLFSFVFFVFYTFPYEVVKETVRSELEGITNSQVQIAKLEPSLLVGLKASDVKVQTDKRQLKLKSVSIHVKLWQLMLGQAGIQLEIVGAKGGDLSLDVSMGIGSILSMANGKMVLPDNIELASNKFDVGQFASIGLGFAKSEVERSSASNPNNAAGALLAPILEQIDLLGSLDSDVDLSFNNDDMTKSKGKIKLKLNKAQMILHDQSFSLPPQNFQKAQFGGDLSGGSLKIAKNSGMQSEEIGLDVGGDIKLKPKLMASLMNLIMNVQLGPALNENYGMIVSAMVPSAVEGKFKIKVGGVLRSPRFSTE